MHHLTKNEQEYLSNLFDVSQPDHPIRQSTSRLWNVTEPDKLAKIDPACLRRLNLLTAKERPFCSYCNGLVGFTWFKRISSKERQDGKEDEVKDAEDAKMDDEVEKDVDDRSPNKEGEREGAEVEAEDKSQDKKDKSESADEGDEAH